VYGIVLIRNLKFTSGVARSSLKVSSNSDILSFVQLFLVTMHSHQSSFTPVQTAVSTACIRLRLRLATDTDWKLLKQLCHQTQVKTELVGLQRSWGFPLKSTKGLGERCYLPTITWPAGRTTFAATRHVPWAPKYTKNAFAAKRSRLLRKFLSSGDGISSAFLTHNAFNSRMLSPQTEKICLVF